MHRSNRLPAATGRAIFVSVTLLHRRLRFPNLASALGALLCAACTSLDPTPMLTLRHVNPDGMHKNPAFSQAITVHGPHETVYVGGQNAVDVDGQIVGRGDVALQATQVARNVRTVLDEVGATSDAVVKWNVHLVQGQDARVAMQAFLAELGVPERPPTVTVLLVAGLAHPDFLLEVDAVAVLPIDG